MLMPLRRHYRGKLEQAVNVMGGFASKRKTSKGKRMGRFTSALNKLRRKRFAEDGEIMPGFPRRASAPNLEPAASDEAARQATPYNYYRGIAVSRTEVDGILSDLRKSVKTRIPEVALSKSFSGSFAVYIVHVTVSEWTVERGWETGEPPDDVKSWSVIHRYSTFKNLRKRLKQKAGDSECKAQLPSVPPTRKGGRSLRPAYVEWKRSKLEEFLDSILKVWQDFFSLLYF